MNFLGSVPAQAGRGQVAHPMEVVWLPQIRDHTHFVAKEIRQ